MEKRIPIPYIDGQYVNIYAPSSDVYLGPDSENFRHGQRYDSWTANDFSVSHRDEEWYLTGITHPTPEGLRPDGFQTIQNNVHESEFQLFLASSNGMTFGETVKNAASGRMYKDMPKLLWPYERPDERPEAHAPHLLPCDDGWKVIYGPVEMRCAEYSRNFELKKRSILFTDEDTARDPYVFRDGDLWKIVYCVANRIQMRTSKDFEHWSDPMVLQVNPFSAAASESPFVLKRDGWYYLLWTIWDNRNGTYDWRTFVFAAESLEEIGTTAPLTILPSHTPEIVSDESGDWLLSVFYPYNGVNAVRLKWAP